jgi:hypothetical protein
MADKENEHPSVTSPFGAQKQPLRASARLLSPAALPVGSSVKMSGLRRRSSVGNLSPEQAKQIVLKALGSSPSREALARFVGGLSKDERRLLLGDSRSATPKANGVRLKEDGSAPASTIESVSAPRSPLPGMLS